MHCHHCHSLGHHPVTAKAGVEIREMLQWENKQIIHLMNEYTVYELAFIIIIREEFERHTEISQSNDGRLIAAEFVD